MNRAKFYAALRKRDSGVFGTSLSKGQVKGMEAILGECAAVGCDLGQTAYILATGHGETGGKMQPVRENMYYSSSARVRQVFGKHRRQGIPASKLARNPKLLANTVYGGAWGEKNLGNRPGTNDGWNFRGFWIGQITGLHNAKKWGAKLGIDLVNNPHLTDSLEWAVRGLVRPMMEGWATKYNLRQFVRGDKRDYVGARAVWNGSFEAEKYADRAKAFEKALEAGGWATPAKTEPNPPARRKGGFWGRLFGRK